MLEAGGAGLAGGGDGAARGVLPVQHLEHRRGGGLHAERDAGEAGVEEPGEVVGAGGFRVGLGGDLGAGVQAERVADGVEDAAEAVCAEQARGAAADEYRVGSGQAARGCELEFFLERVQVLGVGGIHLSWGVGVEVAVPAARGAKRDVDVNAE